METQTKLWTEQEARRLLELEADAIFGLEHRQDPAIGTFTPHGVNNRNVYAAYLWSPQAQFTVTQADIPVTVDEESSRQNYIPGESPLLLRRLCSLLNLPLSCIQGGPSYVVSLDILMNSTQQPRTALPILTSSDDSQVRQAKELARPDNWEADEWAELLGGKLGPWAMALDGREPVSICYSARRTPKAADAGIWTHRRHRGKGLAPAVVAAWARLEAPGKEAIFYSTSASNTASQSVALKLNLKLLGWIWKLEKPAGEETQ